MNVPQDIYNAVNPVAQQYGVPPALWEDVAFVESGFNPRAVGDNGTSFGLFQLHVGGQLPPQYNNNPAAVYDPGLNARLAMPGIARAWNALNGSFKPTDSAWWQRFAAMSGHPGGSPGQAVTDSEASKLQANYNGSGTPGAGGADILCLITPGCINPTSAGQGVAQVTQATGLDQLASFFDQLPGLAVQAGLFLLAVILLIVGFIVLVKP